MYDIEEITRDLEQHQEFMPFFRIFREMGEEIVIQDSLYNGIWCDYIADLNDGVTWDLELILSGLNKVGINPNSGLILDLCCGEGRLARYLNQQGFSVGGIDSSTHQIERARTYDFHNVEDSNWRVADVLDLKSFQEACSGWNVVAAATSAASVNCFGSLDQLRLFLKNARQVLSDSGSQLLLLPVFSDEAINHFKDGFHGNVICHPFRSSDGSQILAWTSYLYEADSRSLLQPALAAVPSHGGLSYEFCYSIDRIWTSSEIEYEAKCQGWRELFSLPSRVVGGGANQWPFTLIALGVD